MKSKKPERGKKTILQLFADWIGKDRNAVYKVRHSYKIFVIEKTKFKNKKS